MLHLDADRRTERSGYSGPDKRPSPQIWLSETIAPNWQMIKKSRKRFLKLFFENICPAILKPPLRIDLSIIPAEGVEREEKMRKFL